MSKKLIIILVSVLLVLVAGGAWYKFGAKKQTTITLLSSQTPKQEEKIETLGWKDPAGFSFSYNKEFKIDNHPEDEINYANLDLASPDHQGLINITVSDSSDQIETGNSLDTQVANLAAKKVLLPEGTVTVFSDSDKVTYKIKMDPQADKDFWNRNYDLILSSFKLIPIEGESEDSARLQTSQSSDEQTGGEEGAIVEDEEVVE